MAQELFATIGERSIEAISPLVATGKLAQIANGFLYGDGNEDAVFIHSLKIDWLRELVESLDGEPLLVAYEFIEDLRTIRRAFKDVPTLSDATPKEASRLIEAWNAGELPLLAFHPACLGPDTEVLTEHRGWARIVDVHAEERVFDGIEFVSHRHQFLIRNADSEMFISHNSAGHGLNLQFGGARMAWLSPSWSAELTDQSIARIYRPGQTRHVTIHVCTAAGTVDEMKRNRVLGKMSAQEAFTPLISPRTDPPRIA
jgi:hypothetical protein